jgi:hypothetical protein
VGILIDHGAVEAFDLAVAAEGGRLAVVDLAHVAAVDDAADDA